MIGAKGTDLIQSYETLRLKPYDDQTGQDISEWSPGATIGWGHLVTQDQWFRFKDGITRDEAAALFRADLTWVEDCLSQHVRVPLSRDQYDALCSLIFNIGAPQFKGSTLLKLLNGCDYIGAAGEFSKWNKSQGKVMPGLVKRRAAEQALFRSVSYMPDGEPQPQEPTMAPFIAAALPSIIDAIPKLGRIFGSGSAVAERNLKAAEVAVEVVKEATGAANAQAAVEAIQSDPAKLAAAQAAIETRWLEIAEAGGGGIDGARRADAAARAGGAFDFLRSPSWWALVLLLPLVYMVVLSLIGLLGTATWSDDVRAGLAGSIVSAVIGGAVGYFWGQVTSRNRGA